MNEMTKMVAKVCLAMSISALSAGAFAQNLASEGLDLSKGGVSLNNTSNKSVQFSGTPTLNDDVGSNSIQLQKIDSGKLKGWKQKKVINEPNPVVNPNMFKISP